MVGNTMEDNLNLDTRQRHTGDHNLHKRSLVLETSYCSADLCGGIEVQRYGCSLLGALGEALEIEVHPGVLGLDPRLSDEGREGYEGRHERRIASVRHVSPQAADVPRCTQEMHYR